MGSSLFYIQNKFFCSFSKIVGMYLFERKRGKLTKMAGLTPCRYLREIMQATVSGGAFFANTQMLSHHQPAKGIIPLEPFWGNVQAHPQPPNCQSSCISFPSANLLKMEGEIWKNEHTSQCEVFLFFPQRVYRYYCFPHRGYTRDKKTCIIRVQKTYARLGA